MIHKIHRSININPAMSVNEPRLNGTPTLWPGSNKSKRPFTNQAPDGYPSGCEQPKVKLGTKKVEPLHIQIVVLLVLVYACHVIGSPFIRFIQDHTALTIIYALETLLLVVSILCFVKMCFVNWSWTATKPLFHRQASGHTYLYFG